MRGQQITDEAIVDALVEAKGYRKEAAIALAMHPTTMSKRFAAISRTDPEQARRVATASKGRKPIEKQTVEYTMGYCETCRRDNVQLPCIACAIRNGEPIAKDRPIVKQWRGSKRGRDED